MQLQKYKQRAGNRVADTTLNTRTSALRQFRNFIGDDEPAVQDVENWVEHMILQHDRGEIKASTIREYYKAVASYWRIMHGNDEEISHMKQWLPKSDVDHGDFLDFEEWELLRQNAMAPRESTFIDIMYYYARRPGEVLLINLEDINYDENTIRFNILKSRHRSNGTISVPTYDDGDTKEVLRATFELHPEVKQSLEKYEMFRSPREETIQLDGSSKQVHPLFTAANGRVHYQTIYDNIKKIANKAGIRKNITPKSLRHTRSTHLDWEGNEPGTIARQQLVHSPATGTNVIQGYIHERGEEEVREVMTTEHEQ